MPNTDPMITPNGTLYLMTINPETIKSRRSSQGKPDKFLSVTDIAGGALSVAPDIQALSATRLAARHP